MNRVLALLVLTLVLTLSSCSSQEPGPPFPPEEALKTFHVEEGFQVELFASEPLVEDPVALDFDAKGRVYVVEMPGYPLDRSPSGRVKLLKDRDQDGKPDEAIVFVDGLVLPTGVMCWKKGILVTAAPNVWYFEDTDGDDRADIRQVVLTGFAFSNPQHTVSDPVYGLDNWIYLANEPAIPTVIFKKEFGDPGTDLRFPDDPAGRTFPLQGRNVAFQPDRYDLHFLSGSSQFGQTFDRWGHHFTVMNSDHVREEVMPARYLARNPDLLVSNSMQSMSDHGNAARVFPLSEIQVEMLTDVGQFTSACALTVYQGELFPENYLNTSFVAEPVHNLVHVDEWVEDGSTYIARRMRQEKEFLASTDSWFRPVFLHNGPDGALYLVDYYREYLEHPEWMAREAYESRDLYRGQTLGRIYRIAPKSAPLQGHTFDLNQASLDELTRKLESPDLWWRRTAQRLLVERQDPQAVPLLSELARKSRSPLARLHALWTLEGLSALTDEQILTALSDPVPGVRENAVRLAEPRMKGAPALQEALLNLASDTEPKVRFQLLCTLGSLDGPGAREAREFLLFENLSDTWMRDAALSASGINPVQLFQRAVTVLSDADQQGSEDLFLQLGSMTGSRNKPQEVQALAQAVTRPRSAIPVAWRAAALEGFADGLAASGVKDVASSGLDQDVLLPLLMSPEGRLREALLQLVDRIELSDTPLFRSTLDQAVKELDDPDVDVDLRVDLLRFVASVNPESNEDLLRHFLDSKFPEPLRMAAAQGLARIKGKESTRYLLDQWRSLTPAVREAALAALFRSRGKVPILIDSLESGVIQPSSLPHSFRLRLMMLGNQKVREHVRSLLLTPPAAAAEKLEIYRKAAESEGDTHRGAEVFKKVCSRCHQLDGIGDSHFGPDLATVRNKPREVLMRDILVPNNSIAQEYEVHIIQTKNGEMVDGIVAARGPETITLRHEDGTETVIPRRQIRNIRVADLSAMPEDLDQEISVEGMADLLSFLKRGVQSD